MGRPRVYKSDTERKRARRHQAAIRQQRFREVHPPLKTPVQVMIEALAAACDRGRSSKLTNHLPFEDSEALAELTRRLEDYKIVLHRLDAERATQETKEDGHGQETEWGNAGEGAEQAGEADGQADDPFAEAA